MANLWWTDADTDNDGNNGNNWNTQEDGGGASGSVPTSGDNACFSNTASSANCNLSGAFDPDNIYMNSSDTGGTDDWSGAFDAAGNDVTTGALKDSSASTIDLGDSNTVSLTSATLLGQFDLGDSCDFSCSGAFAGSGAACTIYLGNNGTTDFDGTFILTTVNTFEFGSSDHDFADGLVFSTTTYDYNTGTITMSGASKALTCANNGSDVYFGDLVISGATTLSVSDGQDVILSDDLDVSAQLTISSDLLLWGTVSNFSDTIEGTANLYLDYGIDVPGGSEINCPYIIFGVNGGGNLGAGDNDAILDCGTTGNGGVTFGAGTHTYGGFINTNRTADQFDVGFDSGVTINIAGDVDFSNTDGTFTVSMEDSVWAVSGNWDFSGVDTLDEGTSEITLSGSSKTYNPKDQDDVHDLIITGTYTQSTGSVTYVQNSVDVQGTLAISGGASCRFMFQGSSTFSLSGTVSGTGQIVWNSDQQMPSGGTISCTVRYFDATSEVTARTYGGEVQVQYTGDNTWVFEAGTHNYNGGITLSTLSGTYSLDFNTNDPTINATDVTFSDTDGTLSVDMGGSTWTVSGNMNLSGIDILTEGTSSITMSGTGKTFTPKVNEIFYDMTISGTITAGSSWVITGTLDVSNELDMGSNFLSVTGTASLTLTGEIIGSNGGIVWTGSNAIPAGGTLSISIYIRPAAAIPVITARTYGKLVSINKSTSGTFIFGAGTFNFNGGLYNTSVTSGTYTYDFATNAPTINVTDVDFSDTDGTFSVDMGGSTWTVTGNMNLSGVDTWDDGTSSIEMSGTSKTLTVVNTARVFYDLVISGTIATLSGAQIIDIANSLTVSDTLSIDNQLNITGAATLTLTGGEIDGAGSLRWLSSAAIPSDGTLSCGFFMLKNDTAEITARTWGTKVVMSNSGDYAFVLEAGTHNFNAGIANTETNSGTYSLDCNTNDPTVNVTDVDFSDTDGTFSVDMGNSIWTVSGNWDTSGVAHFTRGTSSVTLTGSTKTLKFGSSNAFNDLEISGTYTVSTGTNNIIYGTFTLSGTLTLANGAVINLSTGSDAVFTGGTLTGTGSLHWNTVNALPSDGTLSMTAIVLRDFTAVLPARTYDCDVSIRNTTGATTLVFGAGTHTINGNLYNTDVTSGTNALDLNTNNPTINVNGNVDFSDTDGTFTVAFGSNGINVSGNATFGGIDTLTGTGYFVLTGSSKQVTYNSNPAALRIRVNASGTYTQQDSFSSSIDTLVLDAGTYDMGGFDLTIDTLFDHNGGTFIQGTGILTINEYDKDGGTFTGGSGKINVVTLTIDGAGTFTSTSGTLECTGIFDNESGSFVHNSGTVKFSGTVTQWDDSTGARDYYDVEIAGAVTMNGTFPVINGVLTFTSGSIGRLGTETIHVAGIGTPVVYTAGTVNVPVRYRTLTDGTVNVAGGTYASQVSLGPTSGDSNVDVTYNLSAAIQADDFIVCNQKFGDVTFNTQNYSITGDSAVNLGTSACRKITMNLGSSTIDTVDLGSDCATGACTINMGSASVSVSGDLAFSATADVTINAGTSTLTIDGTGAQAIGINSETLNILSVTNTGGLVSFNTAFTTASFICTSAGAAIQFKNALTFNITSVFRIFGNAGTDVTLTTDSAGNAALINATAATREVGYVSLKDMNNSSGSNITVSFGTNVSGNSNWDFVSAFVWDGGGANNLMTTDENWVGDIAPTTGNALRFDATGTKDATYDLTFPITNLDVISGYTGTITQTHDLDATANVTFSDGTFTMGSSKDINVDGTLTFNAGATFNDASGATWTVSGNVVMNAAATMSLTNLTVTADGSAAQDIDLSDETVTAVVVTNTGDVVTFSGGFSGNFTANTSGSSVKFGSTKTYTVGVFTVANVTLAATTGSSAWILNNTGSNSVTAVIVSDSDASTGKEIDASDGTSTDNGGNTHWDFGTTPVVTTVAENKNDKAGGALALLLMR